jgi:hypothetical protein
MLLKKKFKHDKFIVCDEYIFYYFYDIIYFQTNGKININGPILPVIHKRVHRLYEIYKSVKNKIYTYMFGYYRKYIYIGPEEDDVDYEELERLTKYTIDSINNICELYKPNNITSEMIECIIIDYFE